eukprot:6484772-Amphidinium_carterae.1
MIRTKEAKVHAVRLRVAAVNRGLLSVADMTEQGYEVHFARHEAYARHTVSGEVLTFEKRNRVYELSVEVLGEVPHCLQGQRCVPLNPLDAEGHDVQAGSHDAEGHDVQAGSDDAEGHDVQAETHDAEGHDVQAEFHEARVKPAPAAPTKAERQAHSVSHLPYREWCEACVSGRGVRPKHTNITHDGEGMRTHISLDY